MTGDTRHFLELLWGMTQKELRARYKHTVFGFLWIVANPILQMLVIGFVFQFLLPQRIEHYYYLLFTGLLAWNFFSLSLTKATPSIVYERSLIKKARFPRAVIPLSIILSNLIHWVLALVLLCAVAGTAGLLAPTGFLLLLPAIAWLVLLTVGISLGACALNVRFRDINFFVQAILILWFYATPIIYTVDLLPDAVRSLWMFNPLTAPTMLLQTAVVGATLPESPLVIANGILSVVLFLGGSLLFIRESNFFDDWI